MSALRPLASRPSLKFDRKEAKALLRRLRAGDPDALVRARRQHPAIDGAAPTRVALADAQLVVAREYGFSSWPRLVQYYGDVERQRYHTGRVHPPEFLHGSVRSLLEGHRTRRQSSGRLLAAYVPQFYGMRIEDVFASDITEDDARLAVARSNGCASWALLLERAAAQPQARTNEWAVEPLQRAAKAIEAADLNALQRIVSEHPELLHPSTYDAERGGSLLNAVIHHERGRGREPMRPIVEWLGEQGQDLQHELNSQLRGHMRMRPDDVRYLLERGADPNWVAPNGIPVLEHALLRYWNGEAVDVIAARVTPRRALWIAAGLGDIDGVRQFLDRSGKPMRAARRYRPPFNAVGPFTITSLPDADDEEILLEAFWVAILNSRLAVLEYMVSRGFNVNSLTWDTPVLSIAVGNGWTSVVETLVRLGADLDLRGPGSNQSARETAREMYRSRQFAVEYRRIVELCGLDPDLILAAHDAQRPHPPGIEPKLQEALDLADDDAFRRGQADVRAENLLFGLLRAGGLPLVYFTQWSGMDRERFHAEVMERVRAGKERVPHESLPVHDEATAMIDAARALAYEGRRETVNALHLLHSLLREEQGATVALLTRFGGSAAKLREALNRGL